MQKINVKVINMSPSLELPEYQTPFAGAMDLQASFDNRYYDDQGNLQSDNQPVKVYHNDGTVTTSYFHSQSKLLLNPGERALIPTCLKIALPIGFEANIKPRSGLALKQGITVLNTPGLIDADYRGVIGVILINLGSQPFKIIHGMRIAQLDITESFRVYWDATNELDETERGEGGFGHSDA